MHTNPRGVFAETAKPLAVSPPTANASPTINHLLKLETSAPGDNPNNRKLPFLFHKQGASFVTTRRLRISKSHTDTINLSRLFRTENEKPPPSHPLIDARRGGNNKLENSLGILWGNSFDICATYFIVRPSCETANCVYIPRWWWWWWW